MWGRAGGGGVRSSERRVQQLRRFGEGGGHQRGSEAGRGGLQGLAGVVREAGSRDRWVQSHVSHGAFLERRPPQDAPGQDGPPAVSVQSEHSPVVCLARCSKGSEKSRGRGARLSWSRGPVPDLSAEPRVCSLCRDRSPEPVFSVSRGGPRGGPGWPARPVSCPGRTWPRTVHWGLRSLRCRDKIGGSQTLKGSVTEESETPNSVPLWKNALERGRGGGRWPGPSPRARPALPGRSADGRPLTRSPPLLSDGCSPS